MNGVVRLNGWRMGAALALLITLVSPALSAQEPDEPARFDVQQFNPMPSQQSNYLGLSTARVLESLQWEIGVLGNYANDPLVLRAGDGTRIQSIVGSQLTLNFLAAIGLGNIFELGVDFPLILTQEGDEIARMADFDASSAELGPGDLRVVPKLQLFSTDTEDRPGGVAMALLINGFIPTGDDQAYQGEGFRLEPRLAFDFVLEQGTRFGLNVGYMFREAGDFGNLEYDDTLTYGFGLDIVTSRFFHIVTEIVGEAAIMAEDIDTEELPLEALLGFKIFPLETLLIELGAGGGLIEGFGVPDFRAFLGISYGMIPPKDPDHDGIYGDDDQCPLRPEDPDGFEDEDGCPDPDNDQDDVLDVYDGCPMDPEDRDRFEDDDGCPDPDNDQDGVLDANDQCPLDPEDVDGFEDVDGCPDIDNDQDGILDVEDQCRNEPEDRDQFEDDDGCPDPDNDQDGILDVDDQCPLEAEVWNAFEDEDGCPDEGIIELTCERINIYEKVYFETDSDVIRSRSFTLLNNVASVLIARPDIRLVRVEGHTDDRGSDSYNLDLSNRRANSVRNYLVDRGVPPERLVAQGFGESQPIADNRTRDGRAQNRRVEFVIVEQEGCQ